MEFRREISSLEADAALRSLIDAQVEPFPSRDLLMEAHDLAIQLGWAKTYDAEFVVLARRLDARLLTIDARLARIAARFVDVVIRRDG